MLILGTKIPNESNLFRETKQFHSCVRIHACVTQFLKIRAISSIPGFSSPLSYVFWRMRLVVRKKWQVQVRSGNCVCPIMMDDCKCGKIITHCVVVTPLSPVNGPSVSRYLAHAQL